MYRIYQSRLTYTFFLLAVFLLLNTQKTRADYPQSKISSTTIHNERHLSQQSATTDQSQIRAALLSTDAKYVLFFIGDGMGPEHVKAARLTKGSSLSFENLTYHGTMSTHSADNSITDSAAAATAMATATKVNNGVISLAIPGDSSELETMMEIHKANGKSVGLVTTTYVTHATPAAFGAHESSRNNTSQIANDYLTQSRPHVLLGGGSNGISTSAASNAGYTVVTTRAEMQAIDTESATFVSGQFGNTHLPYEFDGDYSTLPHLSEMTETAFAILDNNTSEGFFLMVEGGRIDHAGHANERDRNIEETLEFGRTIQQAIDWINDTNNDSSWANTILLVTADHETGGLTVTQDNGAGNYPNVTWSSTGHTGVDVDIFAQGVGADQVLGASRATIDNTGVFAIMSGPTAPTAPQACTTFNLTSGEDTWIERDSATTTHGADATLATDGSPDRGILIKWDLSSVTFPAGSSVSSATITVQVSNSSGDAYPLYALNRDWSEAQANWNVYSTGNNWGTAGAQSVSADRDGTSLGSTPSDNSTGSRTIQLNASGLAQVEAWLAGTDNNYGFIISEYDTATASDSFQFDSFEGTIAPELSINVCEPSDVGNFVFIDNNRNGVQDSGEGGLAGVAVELWAEGAGSFTQSTSTDGSGSYGFTGVANGNYYIKFVLPSGYLFTSQNADSDDTIDSDADPSTGETPIFTYSGTPDTTIDAGVTIAPPRPGPGEMICYAISDNGGGGDPDDLWAFNYNPSTQTVSGAVELYTNILGNITGGDDIESMEYDFNRDVMITGGADGGDLIVEIDPVTGQITPWSAFSTGLNGEGDNGAANATQNITDIDGMGYDPLRDVWYGSQRNNQDNANNDDYDFIFAFDVDTQDWIPGYFPDCDGDGDRDDYIRPTNITQRDIDGLSFNPFTGEIVGVTNEGPTSNTRIFTIDPLTCDSDQETGQLQYENPASLGTFNDVIDIEGIAIDSFGNTLISSGADAAVANQDPNTINYIMSVDLDTAIATPLAQLQDPVGTNNGDFESLTCQTYNPFAVNLQGAIGNRVWIDENANGVQDSGEPGLPNVVVELTTSAGAIFTTTTDSNGSYLFSDLGAGTYTVQVVTTTLPAELSATTTGPANSDYVNQAQPYTVILSAGDENLTADFGYNWNDSADVNGNLNNAELGDRVWIDANSNGRQDGGELGVSGILVNLIGPGADGVFGTADDAMLDTATTDSNGNYLFNNLSVGVYQTQVDASNFNAGQPLERYTQTGDPDHFGTTGGNNDNMTTQPVVLAPGDVFLNADYGYVPPTSEDNTIGDTVWLDADADGVIDGNEQGIADVSVVLIEDTNQNGVYDDGEPIIATDITDSSGQYLFDGVPDGDYIVWVNDVNNVLNEYAPTYDQDGIATRNTSAVTALNGDDLTHDFGYAPSAMDNGDALIGDTIFLDSNNDGSPDPGEGIEGVTVILQLSSGVTLTTVTDENGMYAFGGLLDSVDSYTVIVDTTTLPPGLTNSADPDNGTPNQSVIDLGNDPDGTNDGINLDQDFGYTPSGTAGSIGNQIWYDRDADGLYESATESGVAGVTVDLYYDANGNGRLDAGEVRIGSTTTNGSGTYSFNQLPVDDGGNPVNYIVDVSDRNGVLSGYWHSETPSGGAGLNDNSQSDPHAVQLSSGSPDYNAADFGYYAEPGAIGNIVWLDTSNDGLLNNSETGIAGVTVTLRIDYPTGAAITLTQVTSDGSTDVDADGILDPVGSYHFGNLLLDEDYNGEGGTEPTYTVTVVTPTGLTSTYDGSADATGAGNGTDNNADDPTGEAAAPVQGATDDTNDFAFTTAYAIGNLIWVDTEATANGTYTTTDTLADGVEVQLFHVDTSPSAIETLILTTTTVNGVYQFTGVPAGSYLVRIPAREFQSGGALFDADDGVPYTVSPNGGGGGDDDSGHDGMIAIAPQLTGVESAPFILDGTQPMGEDSHGAATSLPDNQTNWTIDFAFATPDATIVAISTLSITPEPTLTVWIALLSAVTCLAIVARMRRA